MLLLSAPFRPVKAHASGHIDDINSKVLAASSDKTKRRGVSESRGVKKRKKGFKNVQKERCGGCAGESERTHAMQVMPLPLPDAAAPLYAWYENRVDDRVALVVQKIQRTCGCLVSKKEGKHFRG